MTIRTTLVVCFVAFLGAAATTATTGQKATLSGYVLTVEMPAQWVPMTAEIVQQFTANTNTGYFYRRADGSSAKFLETSRGVAITIHNTRLKRSFWKLGDRGWESGPLSASALLPPRRELRLHAGRYAVISDPVIGDVYEVDGPSGIARVAPRLNGLMVSVRSTQGAILEYRNIRLEVPPDSHFEPPAGAVVRDTGREVGK